MFMPSINGPSITSSGRDEFVDALDQRVGQAFLDRPAAPFGRRLGRALGAIGAIATGNLEQPLGRIGPPIQDHVLDRVAQLARNVVVDRELTGIDDTHVHSGTDRVVEKHRVHRFAHDIIAAKRERDIADSATDQHPRQTLFDLARGLDKSQRIIVVFFDASGDGEDIRVENDVLRREADLLGQQPIGPLADGHASLDRVRLPLLIEGHDDDGRTITEDFARLLQEGLLAFLEADRIHDSFTLQALEAGFDHLPARRVDHDRNPCDVGLASHQFQEPVHRGDRVQHAFIHVDIDDLGAVLDLLQRDLQRAVVVSFGNQSPETRGAGHVGALTDIDEQRIRANVERLQATETRHHRQLRHRPWPVPADRRPDRGQVFRRRAAAAADDVHQPVGGELAQHLRHVLRAVVIFAEFVRQPGIRMYADSRIRHP